MAMNQSVTDTGAGSGDETQLQLLLNRYRSAHGLDPVTLDPTLSDAARAKAWDLALSRHDYPRNQPHTSPLLGTPSQQQVRSGLRGDGSENWAIGPNMAHVQAQFEANTRARENQLRANIRSVGIGLVKRPGDYVVVQHFA